LTASLSTHVLDTGAGRPVAGVRVELYRGDELLASEETNDDGRVGLLHEALEPGEYRLLFRPPGAFFRRVEVAIEVGADPHYHVPLLLAPFACTIYRGS
jgi:5-hydroxyisourate hydrolase